MPRLRVDLDMIQITVKGKQTNNEEEEEAIGEKQTRGRIWRHEISVRSIFSFRF